MSSGYETIRSAVVQTGTDSRVEVNQRALIDKILARYASAGAVYRELLQNSNDAEAKRAEVRFTTTQSPKGPVVSQVVYRNNGHPFRPQDWARLRKIAEGNPDVSKVGAFGVGAYTMFSICEEPLVVSGGKALAFAWKGDALWVRLADSPEAQDEWTTFVLKSRDLYPLPDLVEFGQFLCSSLTFTNFLQDIDLFVDEQKRMSISKRPVGQARVITPPKSSSWWSSDGAVTSSPKRVFTLGRSDGSITESMLRMSVTLDGSESTIQARYVSALADTRIPSDMARRMVRVTKKQPPSQVKIEIFIDANSDSQRAGKKSPASAITEAFTPRMGAGRVFIGFKTSQTTGLAAHLAAPLIPTVEREAIDFQEPTLYMYNAELLSVAGILMRLTLEHSMDIVGQQWGANAGKRLAYEEEQKRKDADKNLETNAASETTQNEDRNRTASSREPPQSSIFSFARFMTSGVKKIADVISSGDFLRDGDEDLLKPKDPRPLSEEEHDAILLMRAFAPQQSTPDSRVGAVIAQGFEMCFPELSPPVLTKSGIARGKDARLPFNGIEGFVEANVVRSVILKNAEAYLIHVAGCRRLSLQDLSVDLKDRVLTEDDFIRIMKWWNKYYRTDQFAEQQGKILKGNILVQYEDATKSSPEEKRSLVSLRLVEHYVDDSRFTAELPVPSNVLPRTMQDKLTLRVLKDRSFGSWFSPLEFRAWVNFVSTHPAMAAGLSRDAKIRLQILSQLSQEQARLFGQEKVLMTQMLKSKFSELRCIPFEGEPAEGIVTEFPRDLYLSSAELDIFDGRGTFKKVSASLSAAGVSDEFLLELGVRKTISMDFLFSQLDSLKWSRNPKPLINYLRTVTLTPEDLHKLRTTQYLPEAQDKTRPYAPSELYLPSTELMYFPFVKVLQWPMNDILDNRSAEWQFLMKLGCHEEIPLEKLVSFLATDIEDEKLRQHGLDYIYKRLTTRSDYDRTYSRFMNSKFLPARVEDPLGINPVKKELESPKSCYSDEACKCLGFAVLNLGKDGNKGRGYAQVFRVAAHPSADLAVQQLLTVVSIAKSMSSSLPQEKVDTVMKAFQEIFRYMSSRAAELDKRTVETLNNAQFIPLRKQDSIVWCSPRQVYFENTQKGSLASMLFLVTEFSPFLATVGVKREPSTEDLLALLVSSPRTVLQKLGSEEKYRSLLRRIAATPGLTITKAMRSAPFLLGFRLEEAEGESLSNSNVEGSTSTSAKYTLARAADICIVDNSYFSRLFDVLSAPQETTLEDFYKTLGSSYISKSVQTRFSALGGQRSDTLLTNEFAKRLRERRPLLVSNIVANHVSHAEDLLSDDQLDIYEVSQVKALYTYRGVTKSQLVTCAASASGKKRLTIFVTQDFDWFDVGNAIGSVILKRCNVQDAFFIGSLLEAPLQTLRARGFPVDRILRGSEPIEPHTDVSTTNSPGDDSTTQRSNTQRPNNSGEGASGFEDILAQMFPDCKRDYIRQLLGPNPDLNSLKVVADTLANGKYPKEEQKPQPAKKPEPPKRPVASPPSTRNPKSPAASIPQPPVLPQPSGSSLPHATDQGKKPFSRIGSGNNVFSRAFRNLRGSSHNMGLAGAKPQSGASSPSGRVQNHLRPGEEREPIIEQDTNPIGNEPDGPPNDLASQHGIQRVLESSVRSSQPVSAEGVSSPEHQVVSVPEAVEQRAGSCEAVPAQDLKPIAGPHKTGKTSSGVRVLASRKHADSEETLLTNWSSVEQFAHIILQLCDVYSLRPDTVAIFHEPSGRTIAFNAGRAVHLNVRYFLSLHANNITAECYSFWYTTIAHELAHNLAIPHAKKHGFYTEAYVHTYLPKLLNLLKPN